jgi:uncharacterized OB-fold protein
MAGIVAAGFYIPRSAITSEAYRKAAGHFSGDGIAEKSVAEFDEDEITMAVAAGDRLLADVNLGMVHVLAFATSNSVTGAALVADALGIDPAKARDVRGADAGEMALAGAIEIASRDEIQTLVIAAEAPRSDPSTPEEDPLGAGAVALLVTSEGVPWSGGPGPSQSAIRRKVGDVGAASVLLSFLTTLEPSKITGDIDVTGALKSREYVTYERYLAMRRRASPRGTEYSQGAYVSLPAYLSEKKARYRLVGEACTECKRVHFPPREACLGCGARSWVDIPLKRTGTVYANTVIGKGAAPSEFLEQQLATGDYATAVVELDDGPRITAMLTDVEPAAVRIGMRVRMVFRRIYAQEGFVRYGFKFAPA